MFDLDLDLVLGLCWSPFPGPRQSGSKSFLLRLDDALSGSTKDGLAVNKREPLLNFDLAVPLKVPLQAGRKHCCTYLYFHGITLLIQRGEFGLGLHQLDEQLPSCSFSLKNVWKS